MKEPCRICIHKKQSENNHPGICRICSHNYISRFESIPEPEAKCNFLDCFAGWGVAGNLQCVLNGDYTDPNCSKFKDSDEEMKRWQDESD